MIIHYLSVKPGDEFVSLSQNFYFHKGAKYKVSKCFDDHGKIVIFMTDKFGFDVPHAAGEFDMTAKTSVAVHDRMLRSRLNLYWESLNDHVLKLKGGPWSDPEYIRHYELSKAHFLDKPDAIAAVRRWKRVTQPDGTVKHYEDKEAFSYFMSINDFYAYFEDLLKDNNDWQFNFGMPGVNSTSHTLLDFMTFMKHMNYPRYDRSLINPPAEEIKLYKRYNVGHQLYDSFLRDMSEVIFDKKTIDQDWERNIIIDMLQLFNEMPKSFGSTAITKILLGKSKLNNAKAVPYMGRYAGKIKYDQAFELCHALSQYMFDSDVFITKEEYSSGTEWRGDFEFIGSKMVDVVKLNTFIENTKNFGGPVEYWYTTKEDKEPKRFLPDSDMINDGLLDQEVVNKYNRLMFVKINKTN